MYIYHIQYCRFVWTKVHFETYRYLLITPICNHQLQVKSLPSNYQFESEVPHIHPPKTNMDRGHEIRKKKIFSKFRTILRYLCRDASAQRHQQKQQQTLGESWQKRILLDPANYDFPEFNSFAPKHCVPKHHFSGRYVRAWWWNHLCPFLWGLKWPRVQTMSGKKRGSIDQCQNDPHFATSCCWWLYQHLPKCPDMFSIIQIQHGFSSRKKSCTWVGSWKYPTTSVHSPSRGRLQMFSPFVT